MDTEQESERDGERGRERGGGERERGREEERERGREAGNSYWERLEGWHSIGWMLPSSQTADFYREHRERKCRACGAFSQGLLQFQI